MINTNPNPSTIQPQLHRDQRQNNSYFLSNNIIKGHKHQNKNQNKNKRKTNQNKFQDYSLWLQISWDGD